MNTPCEKCIFSDYADSQEPCKFNVIPSAKKYHTITIKNNFNYIQNYRCPYAFSIEYYKSNSDTIGDIDKLESELLKRASIAYYLMIDIHNPDSIADTCKKVNSLSPVPKFVSFILHKENTTNSIIDSIKNKLDPEIQWKVHNFLEDSSVDHIISTVLDTNIENNDSKYFWFNTDADIQLLDSDIKSIGKIITLEQPECSAMFRTIDHSGLFISFDVYKNVRSMIDINIFYGLKAIPNVKFNYYA